jgi:hypothetical protein
MSGLRVARARHALVFGNRRSPGDRRAVAREAERYRPPDPSSTTSDYRNAVIELSHRGASSLVDGVGTLSGSLLA